MVDYSDIENLNEHQARELLIKELRELEEGFEQTKALRQKIKDELGSLEKIDDLLLKIANLNQVLFRAEKSIHYLARSGYYGAQLQDVPPEVVNLRRLHDLFRRLHLAVQKLREHLVENSGTINEYESFIARRKIEIEKYSGKKRYRYIFSYLDPTNYRNKNRSNLGAKKIASRYRGDLYLVRSFAFRFNNEIKIDGNDIHLIVNSIRLAQSIGSHIQNNLETWKRDVSYGTTSGDYTRQRHPVTGAYTDELNLAIRNLWGLIYYLEELADDEEFIRATNIKIVKIDRREHVTIEEMLKLNPGS